MDILSALLSISNVSLMPLPILSTPPTNYFFLPNRPEEGCVFQAIISLGFPLSLFVSFQILRIYSTPQSQIGESRQAASKSSHDCPQSISCAIAQSPTLALDFYISPHIELDVWFKNISMASGDNAPYCPRSPFRINTNTWCRKFSRSRQHLTTASFCSWKSHHISYNTPLRNVFLNTMLEYIKVTWLTRAFSHQLQNLKHFTTNRPCRPSHWTMA